MLARVLRDLVAAVFLGATLVACGADTAVESTGTEDGLPDGIWEVATLMPGEPVDLADHPIKLQFNNVGASLRIDTACHRLFGSYTFVQAGRDVQEGDASFSIPGTSTNDCEPAAEAVEQDLLTVLETVSSWEGNQQGLTLLAPAGRLELVPLD